MTDSEFEVLDELYFVQSYAELQESTGYEDALLKDVLNSFLSKGWARCLASRAGEEMAVQSLPANFHACFFLATKAGLLAHNSK